MAITIPHAKCPDKSLRKHQHKRHMCDPKAVAAASLIVSALLYCAHPPTFSVWEGDIARSRCDLNRKEGRSCAWRPDLLKWLKLQKRFWVVDIHSFPREPHTWRNRSDADNAELVLLDNSPNPKSVYRYTTDLKESLAKAGFDVAIVKGDLKINALASTPLAVGAERVYLLEFSEALEDKRLDLLCKAIVHALCGDSAPAQ